MGDRLARAEDFEKKAEKKLSGWGLFGSKFEDAVNLFGKSANSFKLTKSWDKAGSTYIKLANCHLKLGLLHNTAKRKTDPRLYAYELGKGFIRELDYNLEAAKSSKFLEVHSPFAFIRMSKVYPYLSQKRGESPTDLLSLSIGSSIGNVPEYSERQNVDEKRCLLDLVSNSNPPRML